MAHRLRLYRTATWLVIALATALASAWALRVPLLQEPDELAHIDYALELHAVGQPFSVSQAKPVRVYSPSLSYLEAATDYRENRYNPWGKLPAGYGTTAYDREVDAKAPPLDHRVPPSGSGLPYVMFAYPAGYYALVAAAMGLAAGLHPNSLLALMFAARFTSVACLPLTLLLAYGIFKRLKLSEATALLCTIAVAWLPLTSWVSGYVQPDNLTTLLLTASLYVALRWKAEPERIAWPLWLSVALVALGFVKQHYAVAAICATFAAGLSSLRSPKSFGKLVAPFVPPIVAVFLAGKLVPVMNLAFPHFAGQHPGTHFSLLRSFADFAGGAVSGIREIYLGGEAFTDFWMSFGMRGASVYNGPFKEIVRDTLVAVTVVTAFALVLRTWSIGKRLITIARRRSWWRAFCLMTSNVVLNVYVLVTAIVVGVHVISDGAVWLEGRYWFPVIVPTVALGAVIVPRLFVKRRRSVALGFAAMWALYATVSAPLGLLALERSFYQPTPDLATIEPYAAISSITSDARCARVRPGAAISRGCRLLVKGFAVDSERGLPAHDVFVEVDDRLMVRAKTLLPSPLVRDVYIDDALADSGISAALDTRGYSVGPHTIRLKIVERRSPSGLPSRNVHTFVVREP